MFVSVVADEGCLDHLDGGMAADVTECGKHFGVTLTGDDGSDDPHAGGPRDIRHHVMQLQVHLHQRLLHVLDMGRCIFDQTFPLSQIGAEGGDLCLWAETAPQETIGMQLPQPSGIADISLPPRHVFGVAGVHDDHIEPVPIENLVGRNPIDPGGFHRHAGDATGFEPVCQVMQILSEGAKRTHRCVTGIRVDRRHVHGRSDVDGGRRRVDHLEFRVATGHCLCHANSSIQEGGRGPCKSVTFLTGIADKAASPLSSAHQPMCHVF